MGFIHDFFQRSSLFGLPRFSVATPFAFEQRNLLWDSFERVSAVQQRTLYSCLLSSVVWVECCAMNFAVHDA